MTSRSSDLAPVESIPPDELMDDASSSLFSQDPMDDASFRTVADGAPVMLWTCDVFGGYRFFNQQWVTFTGVPLDQLLENPGLLDVHPEDYAAQRHGFVAAFQNRVEFRMEYRLRRYDGQYRWVINSGVPLFNARSEFVGYVGSCVDIHDRKAIEEALAESERKFKLLFEMSADAQLLFDHGQIVDCNPATAALFRVPDRWAIIGKTLADFSPPAQADGSPSLRAGAAAMETAVLKTSHRFGWVARRADGSEFPLEVLLTAIPLNGRTLLHAVCRDLTEQRNLEGRLRQAQKMEAIGTLAGGIAHDFNNILTAIIGCSELAALDVQPNSPAATNLGEVLSAARRARDLVRQILTFSRMDDARRSDFDLAAAVYESARLLRASIPTTVEIRVTTPPGACMVHGNATQMQQVLLNLGANAEHAMRATGGGVLEIALAQGELHESDVASHPGMSPGPVARLVVRDSGAGMPAHVRERAFDPFFTTKPVGEGTGMGLAVVHGIVTAYGGTISVESAPGAGTTFTLVLPRTGGPAKPDPVSGRPGQMPAGQGRVLVVEDEHAIGRMFKRLLGRIGYDVEVHDNARDALDVFKSDPMRFDVVITDLTMPGMTGDVFAAEVLKIRPGIPVILATGYAMAFSPERAKSLGIAAFLRKPLSIAELAEVLRVVCSGGRASGTPERA